jgi:hypothetical protein
MTGAVFAGRDDALRIGRPHHISRLKVGERVDEAEGALQIGGRPTAMVVIAHQRGL